MSNLTTWAIAVAFLCVAWLAIPPKVNQDVAWTIIVAQRMHHGEILYRDLMDINPPLIYWMTGPTLKLGGFIGLSAITAYYGMVLLVLVATFLLTTWGPDRSSPRFIGAVACYATLLLIGPSFGQREQLIAALLMPLIIRLAQRLDGEEPPPWLLWSSYASAVIAMSMKPHFVLVWLALLMALRMNKRRLRWLDAMPVAGGLLYVASVVMFAPYYLGFIASFGSTYAQWRKEPLVLLLLQPGALAGCGAFFLGALVMRRRYSSGVALALALAAGASTAAAVSQLKPFGYHWIPAMAFAAGTAGAAFGMALRKGSHLIWGAFIVVAIVGGAVREAWVNASTARKVLEPLTAWIARQAPESRVLVLSRHSVGVVGAALEQRLRWRNDWQVIWWPSVFEERRYRLPASFDGLSMPERRALWGAARGLLSGTVDAVAVDLPSTGAYKPDAAFDMDEYLRLVPGVSNSLERDYLPPRPEGAFLVYYRRTFGGG